MGISQMVHNVVLRPLNAAAAWGDQLHVLGAEVLLAASVPDAE